VQVSKDDAVAEDKPVTPVVPEETGAAAPEAEEEKVTPLEHHWNTTVTPL
jgi:hypothetical protein